MEFYVIRNGKQFGPLSRADVQAQIEQGNFSTGDVAWTAGLDDWKPLFEVFSTLDAGRSVKSAILVEPCRPSLLSRKRVMLAIGVLVTIAVSTGVWIVVSDHHRTRSASARAGESTPDSFDLIGLAKRARDAVVLIEVFDRDQNEIATGSGFFASDRGVLVTNYHVIEKAAAAVAKTTDGHRFSIKGVLAFDRENDLALLVVDGRTGPFLVFGDSKHLQPGDHIAVIGSPLGLEGSLSEGIVSAKREQSDGNWLQITAPISPGSSGSPVLDSTGKVIGIATAMLRGGQSLNFAMPIELAASMLQERQGDEKSKQPISLEQLTAMNSLAEKDARAKADAEYAGTEATVLNSPEYKTAQSDSMTALAAAGINSLLPGQAQGDWRKALSSAKALTTKYPNSAIAYQQLGDVCKMMGFRDEAINAYQRAVKMNADSPTAWESLGSLYKEKGEFTQADFAFSQAIAFQLGGLRVQTPGFNRSIGLQTLGSIYRSAGNSDAAKDAYRQAIQEDPKTSILALHELAAIYLIEGNEKEAFKVAYQITMWNPRHRVPEAEAWEYLSTWYHEHKREDDSSRCFVNAQRLGLTR